MKNENTVQYKTINTMLLHLNKATKYSSYIDVINTSHFSLITLIAGEWEPGEHSRVRVELCRFIVVLLKHKVSHFYFYFCQKVECRTYFVYFHTFSYKIEVLRTPTESGQPVGPCIPKLWKTTISDCSLRLCSISSVR